MARAYKDLLVWQRAIELTLAIYKFSADFPKSEIYGLAAQIRRAAVSVPSNIAEGYGRGTRGEYRQFLGIARGSLCEVQTQLVLARELGYGDGSLHYQALALADQVGKMLNALIAKLDATRKTSAHP